MDNVSSRPSSGFKNIKPLTRKERLALKDKIALEKSRLMNVSDRECCDERLQQNFGSTPWVWPLLQILSIWEVDTLLVCLEWDEGRHGNERGALAAFGIVMIAINL